MQDHPTLNSSQRRRSGPSGYAIALLVVVIAILIRLPLTPILGDRRPYLTLFGAIAVAAWLARWKPSAVAALVGFVLANRLFAGEANPFEAPVGFLVAEFLTYALSAAVIIYLGEHLHRGRDSAEQRARQLAMSEDAEREQKELLRITLASIGDAVITTNARGLVTAMNSIAEQLTGWSHLEALNQPLDQVFHIINEQTRQRADNPAARALHEGLIVGLANHTLLVSRTGHERPIDDSAAPIRSADGQVLGCVLVFRDVTERRLAEQRINEGHELLRITLSSIGDGVIVTDPQGRIRSLNPEAERLTGWRADDATGKPLSDVFRIVNENTGEPAENPVEDVLRHGHVVALANHTMLVAKDGTRIPIDDSAAPIRERGGPVLGVVLVFRDVTGPRAFHRAQAHLAAIVQYSGDSIITKDLNGVVQSWNASAEALFGYRPEEIIGQSITLLIPPDRLHEETEILHRLRAGEPSERFETERVTKDGRRIHVSVSISPLRDVDGRVIGASKVVHDITDRKLAEAALREADRRKDEFLAVLSHELRNPLAPISMAIGIMQRNPATDPRERELRGVIERQTKQLARLLDDLLDVNRIRSGKIVLRREHVRLDDAVTSAVESARPQIDAKAQHLVVNLPRDPVYVHADAARMAQVISNLLSNASKYTDRGGNIALTVVQKDGNAIMSVRDSGIGIDADQMSRIFDMFAQVHPALDRDHSGLGVGLALTRRLVELHGGQIEVRSEGPGKGSEFIVRLPTAAARDDAEPRGSDATPAPGPAPKRKVLVADDNLDSAQMLAAALRLAGHEVATAHDGVATVETAKTFRPEIALLDIGMPRMNGYDVATRLREEFGPRIMLVAITGWGQESDRRRAEEAGFEHHLTKPVSLGAIESLLSAGVHPPAGD